MKKLKGILVIAVIAAGMFFSTTSIDSEKIAVNIESMDIASIVALETAEARKKKWVWFGCGGGGNYCGGEPNCKSVIVSSNRCFD